VQAQGWRQGQGTVYWWAVLAVDEMVGLGQAAVGQGVGIAVTAAAAAAMSKAAQQKRAVQTQSLPEWAQARLLPQSR